MLYLGEAALIQSERQKNWKVVVELTAMLPKSRCHLIKNDTGYSSGRQFIYLE